MSGSRLAAARHPKRSLCAILVATLLAAALAGALLVAVVRLSSGPIVAPCARCAAPCPCPKLPGTLMCLCPR